MLNLPASIVHRSIEMMFDAGVTLAAAGCALVQSTQGSVKPSAGASESFVGVSLTQPLSLLNYPHYEELTVNGSNQVTLARTPIAGTLHIVSSTGTPLVPGTPASNATDYSLAGNVVTVHASLTATVVTVLYQYAPTTAEARQLQGDIPPGGAASLTTGTVGVILAGTVLTSEYDTTVDWSQANPVIRTGAGGKFTIGGTGAVVPSARVTQIPGVESPLLGIYFSA